MMILTFFAFVTNALYCANLVFVAKEVNYRCKDDLDNSHSCSANSTQLCSEWLYDDTDSFVVYFHLACQDWKRTLVGTVHSFGYLCGLLLVGPMSDRFTITFLTDIVYITYWSGLPFQVFGTVSFLAGLTTFLVPDVSNDLLPDTVVQAEALGKSKIPSKALENYNEGDISQL
nr:uncharacterized protein LOC113397102 [Vanessa tameamea]